jgi:mono/diheme cytochrome c family protein
MGQEVDAVEKSETQIASWYPDLNIFFLVILIVLFGAVFPPSAETAEGTETRISGQMLTVDGEPLMGVIAIEKGRLDSKKYENGGLVDQDGRFSVRVPAGGDYGLHLYATGYIYHAAGVEAKTGEDNRFTFTLPPHRAVKDAPVISEVQFEPTDDSPDQVVIKLSVYDPDKNLSHQVLAVNVRTQEGFIFSPPKFVPPWTRNYPDGIYTMNYDTRGRPFAPEEWLFVSADNRRYVSPVLGHPFTQEGVIAARAGGEGEPTHSPTQLAEASDAESLVGRGEKIFGDNCSMCHYPDKEETKVGPGLRGLFKTKLTPARRRPVTEETIRDQVQNGGVQMPPFPHIKGRAFSSLLAYLKSL